MQVVGLCRFSYPALGGFQVEHDTIEERIAYLYAPERMEERFRTFEHVVLPCLRAQTDQDFHFIVVIGDSLPEPYLERLLDLTDTVPQVLVHAEPPKPQRQVMKQVLNQSRLDPDEPCLQFRLDDDDAVAVDFVERLRKAARDCQGFMSQHKSVAIDFSRGFIAELGPDGISAKEHFRHFDTAALGMYVRGGCQLTIMNFAHSKIAQFMPAITFEDPPMFVRTHNTFNDSRQKKVQAVEVDVLTADQEAMFKARFGLDSDAVRKAYSS